MRGKSSVYGHLSTLETSSRVSDLRKYLLSEIEKELPRAQELRRYLHQNPEVSGNEFSTSKKLKSELGIEMEPAAESGFVVRYGPNAGGSVLIRAELDALPIAEQTGVDWASTNNAMHACGHDIHMAGWAAFNRAALRADLPKAVTAVLQPREEEYPSGAKDIVDESWLEKFNVDSAIAVHVHPSITRNHVAIGQGAINAAADTLRVTYTGTGGHGAYPHKAQSPVPALASLAAMLPGLRQNVIDPTEAGVITVGQIHAGNAANVIPESGYLEATVRTMSVESRTEIYKAVRALAQAQADAWGVSAKVEIDQGEPVLLNSDSLSLVAQNEAQQVGLDISHGIYSCGADDFSYFSEQVPSLMIFAGLNHLGQKVNLHSPYFLPEEETVRTVALGYLAGYLAVVESEDHVRDESRRDK